MLRLGASGLLISTLLACGGTPDAKHPQQKNGNDADGAPLEALPRYLTVELREDGVWLDGAQVSLAQLDAALRQAATDAATRGVAIRREGGEEAIESILARVAEAGITHVVISGMVPEALITARGSAGSADSLGAVSPGAASPAVVSPAAVSPGTAPSAPAVVAPGSGAAGEPQAAGAASAPPALAPTTPAAVTPPDADNVSLRHYGLHIGGERDLEAVKNRYLEPVEKRFEDLRRCHALAKNPTLQASFGVDLLLSPAGGVPKVKDYRTQIKGKDFQLCVLGVLAEVRWPVPERPTVVSYSVLFKPNEP